MTVPDDGGHGCRRAPKLPLPLEESSCLIDQRWAKDAITGGSRPRLPAGKALS